jgi:hypothetical protein
VVNRVDGEAISSLVVTGSVFVNMDNLILEKISYMDELGTPVEVNDVSPDAGLIASTKKIFFREEAKRRLLKQIIRKHLVTQGMTTDGALVEICRGNA